MIYSIYKLTNTINGKSYIGFTSKTPSRRWQTHLENAQNKRNQYLYNAINKYGWENFTKEVLYSSKDGEHTLHEMEPHFIHEYNTYYLNDHGYNMTLGGDGVIGWKPCAESVRKRSKRMKGNGNTFYGKHHEAKAKEKISIAVKRTRHLYVGEKAPHAGHKHTVESRKQIGDTQAGIWKITFPDEHIETIKNLRAFCRDYLLTAPLMIAVSKGLQHHHKGYKCEKIS